MADKWDLEMGGESERSWSENRLEMPDDDNDDDYIKGRQTGSILFSLFCTSFLGVYQFFCHTVHIQAPNLLFIR